MIGEAIKVGESVLIKVAAENRDWGYNPAPDGTKCLVVGFGTIFYSRTRGLGQRPGKHRNYHWLVIKLPDGKKIDISTSHVEPADKTSYEKRLARLRNLAKKNGTMLSDGVKSFISDLPDLPVWEGDFVTLKPGSYWASYNETEVRVRDVKYDYLESTEPNLRNHIYNIEFRHGGTTTIGPNDIESVRRGNVWKYYHKEPLSFKDIKEEASFYSEIGRTEEVRNPANKMYSWTLNEVLDAIEKGIAHGLSVTQNFFDPNSHYDRAIRFMDEEVGQRIAEHTLRGFNRPVKSKDAVSLS